MLTFGQPDLDRAVDRVRHILVAAEHVQRVAAALDLAGIPFTAVLVVRQPRLQAVPQLFDRQRNERQALFHRLPSHLQGVGDVGQVGVGQALLVQRLDQLQRLRPQAVCVFGRQHNQGRALARHRDGGARRRRIFGNQHTGVRAAGAERRDGRDAHSLGRHAVAQAFGALPLGQLLLHHERAGGEVDMRIEHGRMQRRRQLAMAHL